MTRALGVEPTVDVEVTEVPVLKDDLFLLCSDGLTDMVTDAEIAEAVGALFGVKVADVKELVAKLKNEAKVL